MATSAPHARHQQASRIAIVIAFVGLVCKGSSALAFGLPSAVDDLQKRVGHGITARTLTEILNESEDRDLKHLAVRAAAEFGPDAKEVVPQLVSALEGDAALSKVSTANALASIGPAAAPAVPALTRALADDSPLVRRFAARALGAIGQAANSAIEPLVIAAARAAPEEGLGALAPWDAVAALGQIGPDARPIVPQLMEILERVPASERARKTPDIREVITTALGKIAVPGDRAVISGLSRIARLEAGAIHLGEGSPSSDVRQARARIAAVLSIWKLSRHPRAVGWLTECMADKANPAHVRAQVITALGEIGPPAQTSVPPLIAMFTDSNEDKDDVDWAEAIVAVGKMKPSATSAVRFLADQVGRGEGELSVLAADALGEIGRPARDSRNLIAALASNDYELRVAAADAIRRSGGEEAAMVPVLVECLGTMEIPEWGGEFPGVQRAARMRARAATVLRELGPRAEDAVPALSVALSDPFITVREAAASALRSIAPEK
jgi:HEAT repeat protein